MKIFIFIYFNNIIFNNSNYLWLIEIMKEFYKNFKSHFMSKYEILFIFMNKDLNA